MRLEARATVAEIEADTILDGLSTGVLLVDRDRSIRHLNLAAEDLLGISRNKAHGRDLSTLFSEASEVAEMLERTAATGASYSARELSLKTIPGQAVPITLDCRVSTLLDGSGLLLVELMDAGERLRISRENALMTQHGGSRMMIGQLAHEIKNPLGGLRGAAQLLERDLPDATLRKYTRVIVREADRLTTLVDRLIGPARPLHMELINIHEPLQHVRQLAIAEASRGVRVERDYDPSLPRVSVDRDQMIQAMLNIARNAIEAVSPAGQVWFRTRVLNNVTIADKRHRIVACIAFEDDGAGVPEEIRETLFYPLVTGRPGGTGLGLALAQELVSRHQGRIDYTSTPGRTVFRILLPIGRSGV